VCLVPMFNNHHTMQKVGFGKYKPFKSHGNLYLPKIRSGNREFHDKGVMDYGPVNDKLIPLPSNSSNKDKRYYVTFTLKDSQNNNKENFSEDDRT
jgi:hypothetical protein